MTRGREGDPIPSGLWLIRLVREDWFEAEQGRLVWVDPHAFDLSSDDKKATPPHLSLFVEAMTTLDQAWELGGRNIRKTHAILVPVGAVRSVSSNAGSLDVVWTRTGGAAGPGSCGHVGIVGWQLGDDAASKKRRKHVRQRLADAAREYGKLQSILAACGPMVQSAVPANSEPDNGP
ncbi:MAG: hypothetical protein FJX77_18235 [Armatimonadetes bacterium]|nr:hypothetical protein [Armatimonadota bacterium]